MTKRECKNCGIPVGSPEWQCYPATAPPGFDLVPTEICCSEDCAIARRERWLDRNRGAEIVEVCPCGGEFSLSSYCGCHVCTNCNDHRGLDSCYCGWSRSGGDGRRELRECGESI